MFLRSTIVLVSFKPDNLLRFSALNSFYDKKFAKNKKKQIKELKQYIKNWKSEKNIILITHYVVILEMLDISVSSGEIIISNKNLELIESININ